MNRLCGLCVMLWLTPQMGHLVMFREGDTEASGLTLQQWTNYATGVRLEVGVKFRLSFSTTIAPSPQR
jgi:hypothetical protein